MGRISSTENNFKNLSKTTVSAAISNKILNNVECKPN